LKFRTRFFGKNDVRKFGVKRNWCKKCGAKNVVQKEIDVKNVVQKEIGVKKTRTFCHGDFLGQARRSTVVSVSKEN